MARLFSRCSDRPGTAKLMAQNASDDDEDMGW